MLALVTALAPASARCAPADDELLILGMHGELMLHTAHGDTLLHGDDGVFGAFSGRSELEQVWAVGYAHNADTTATLYVTDGNFNVYSIAPFTKNSEYTRLERSRFEEGEPTMIGDDPARQIPRFMEDEDDLLISADGKRRILRFIDAATHRRILFDPLGKDRARWKAISLSDLTFSHLNWTGSSPAYSYVNPLYNKDDTTVTVESFIETHPETLPLFAECASDGWVVTDARSKGFSTYSVQYRDFTKYKHRHLYLVHNLRLDTWDTKAFPSYSCSSVAENVAILDRFAPCANGTPCPTGEVFIYTAEEAKPLEYKEAAGSWICAIYPGVAYLIQERRKSSLSTASSEKDLADGASSDGRSQDQVAEPDRGDLLLMRFSPAGFEEPQKIGTVPFGAHIAFLLPPKAEPKP